MIEHFAGHEQLNERSTWRALERVFQDRGERKPAKGRQGKPVVALQAKAAARHFLS